MEKTYHFLVLLFRTVLAIVARSANDFLSKFYGESEKSLQNLFDKAREASPSIIFFDEIDALCPVRSSKQNQVHASLVTTILALMDGLENTKANPVFILGATNRLDSIDPALRRPGRFDRELCVPLPNQAARFEILKVHTKSWPQDSRPTETFLLSVAARFFSLFGFN